MISKAVTVDEFLETLAPEERAVFSQLRRLFKKAHPQVEESMTWRMPGYCVGEHNVGAFNKQKNHLCLYVNPEALAPFRKQLGKLDCGKSCIRFRKPGDLPLDVAAAIIKAAGALVPTRKK